MQEQPELTPWFPAKVKPVHVGPYERLTPMHGSPTFQYWDGKKWGYQAVSPDLANMFFGPSDYQFDHKWRGLTSKATA